MKILRGEIYYADLSPHIGSEQGGIRPVLVIQNDVGNHHSTTTIIAAITSFKPNKKQLPTHVRLNTDLSGLVSDSIIECEQIRTIDNIRLKKRLGAIDADTLVLVDLALVESLGLTLHKKEEETQDE